MSKAEEETGFAKKTNETALWRRKGKPSGQQTVEKKTAEYRGGFLKRVGKSTMGRRTTKEQQARGTLKGMGSKCLKRGKGGGRGGDEKRTGKKRTTCNVIEWTDWGEKTRRRSTKKKKGAGGKTRREHGGGGK